MNKWIAEFELEDGDTMPEHMDLEYKGARLDFYCRPMWIPISERLPEDYIHVLCQFYLGGMGECYLAHGAFHVVGGLVMTCNEVVAWMPLPEPYKEESDDKE